MLCLLAGCAAVGGSLGLDGADGDPGPAGADLATAPAVHIESAEVVSVRTDPRAVEEVLGPGSQYRGVDVVTARLESVRVDNPDDVTLPAEVASGETVTLVFLRSARPTRIRRVPANAATAERSGETAAARAEPGSRVVSVNATRNAVELRVRDPGVDSRTVLTLPGLRPGDEFAATARVRRGTFTVTVYESPPAS